MVASKYLQRFISHVKEYYTPETTVKRVADLKIIITEEINVMREVFGFSDGVINAVYCRGRFPKNK